jgi:hypothetical protein
MFEDDSGVSVTWFLVLVWTEWEAGGGNDQRHNGVANMVLADTR